MVKLSTSTQGSKLWMALTGLFLWFFLVIHLLGNLQLFLSPDQAREQFNWYSQSLSGNILIKIISYVLYFSIIAHTCYAIILSLKKKKANGQAYAYDRRGEVSPGGRTKNIGYKALKGYTLLVFITYQSRNAKWQGAMGSAKNQSSGIYWLFYCLCGFSWGAKY